MNQGFINDYERLVAKQKAWLDENSDLQDEDVYWEVLDEYLGNKETLRILKDEPGDAETNALNTSK